MILVEQSAKGPRARVASLAVGVPDCVQIAEAVDENQVGNHDRTGQLPLRLHPDGECGQSDQAHVLSQIT